MSGDRKKAITQTLDVIHYYNVAPVSELGNLELILEAALADIVIRLCYTQIENKIVELQILELFYCNGIWFVSAYDSLDKKCGTYRCDCMEELILLDETKQAVTKDELRDIQELYEEIYHNIRFKCRLTEIGKETFLKNNYPNMRLEIIDGIPYTIGGYN